MSDAIIGTVAPPELHIMTFNIRRRMDGLARRPADRWRTRRPLVQELLRSEQPTLVGVQEALPDQADGISDALGDRYRFIGYGRRIGRRGEACPLYFDASRLELLDWEQRALSDSPAVAGSRSWGNLIPRVIVSATFRDRATGTDVFVANTHLDPFSQPSRVRAAREIRRIVATQPLPAVVTGDLNAGPQSPTVGELLAHGTLTDAWRAAHTRLTPEWGTFPDYRSPRLRGGRIDWIAVTPTVRVSRAAVNARRVRGSWASDHLPVQAVVTIPPTEGPS
ncbi:endonuclease/exonuclease/phosphatase family protein [Microbacterium sp. zg.B48]|uniref:endonuclease/exonuclease/phosphatase family protein n=1 Tax=Microbacterium sp. zg.B48 TaxID=2969408 RepID=UPI00214C3372|nr:endonuclease/exonuclease/phosphatase family protein [Microbacterium sp. zg.B48]MCR2763618.1 endonuclease/exonuclease/phosphatase family protein [Microbacterium sp. zg.B48]